jgi:hypothetical protein
MTGTLGFDYQLIRRGIDRLRSSKSRAQAYLFLPTDNPDSLKLVTPLANSPRWQRFKATNAPASES